MKRNPEIAQNVRARMDAELSEPKEADMDLVAAYVDTILELDNIEPETDEEVRAGIESILHKQTHSRKRRVRRVLIAAAAAVLIVSIGASMTITGIAPGEVEITAQVKDSGATTSCTVTVLPRTAARLPGDADGDCDVTLKDVAQITRYLAGGWDAVIDLMSADVNGDGDVNLIDVILLRRFLAGGWNVTLL